MNPEHLPKPIHTAVSFLANCVRHSPKFAWLHAHRFNGLTRDQIQYLLKETYKETNFTNPTTFLDKLQWLKINYHDPLLTICADKVLVRKYIKDTIGSDYLIPSLGTYSSAKEIPFAKLPSQFVLKVNWGSGQNIICKDKSSLNLNNAIHLLNEWMKPNANHYYDFFEWCYKDIKPKIIAEKFIEQADGFLVDYKIHVFNGKPVLLQFIDRWNSHKETIYHIPNWEQTTLHFTYERLDKQYPKNNTIALMIDLSRKLAKPFPYVRVDFYNINHHIYCGELTFYPGGGNLNMSPEWGRKLGNLLALPRLQ